MPSPEQEHSIAVTAALRAGNKPPADADTRSEFQKLHDRVVQIEQEVFGEGASGIRPYRSTRDRKLAFAESASKPYVSPSARAGETLVGRDGEVIGTLHDHGTYHTVSTPSGPKLVK